jgi:hypothetical protein
MAREKIRKTDADNNPESKQEKSPDARLPSKSQLWIEGGPKAIRVDRTSHRSLKKEIQKVLDQKAWEWPKRRVFFFSDLHADADAFIASLIASGGVSKTGPQDDALKLTKAGRSGLFVIGGDCFDKGPSNLRLLRVLRILRERGARMKILAGNHDVRMLLGAVSISTMKDPRNEHFFVRMGPKVVPFLKEVWEQYLKNGKGLRGVPDSQGCRRILYPSKNWPKRFAFHASWVMPDEEVKRELKRMKHKMARFEQDCEKAGISIRIAYAAAMKWRRLFLHRNGEFAWFFRDMALIHRQGSFLFLHAGLDDRIARIIQDKGLKSVNRMFRKQLFGNPFEFYYGPLANMVRTKYRPVDMPLTAYGANLIHKMGIHAVVHGHLNLCHGQRIMLRHGIVNFECDTTMDRNTRKKEGLPGHGVAVTIIEPDGQVIGISRDHPCKKVFELP